LSDRMAKPTPIGSDSTAPASTGPKIPREAIVDRYFLEHRAKLLDVAAFLDRCDRVSGDGSDDRRLQAMRDAIELLIDGRPERTRRILEQFSDRSSDLLDNAPTQGAIGVPTSPAPGP